MPLFTLLTDSGLVHKTAGLNWGSNKKNHTRIFDAYIPIHIKTIRKNPGFVPTKSSQSIINIIWDDGVKMQGRFEGNLTDSRTGILYPKQISSYPNKDILGRYLRKRLGIIGTRPIVMADLTRYGRTHIEIINLGGNQYRFNFS